VEKLFVLKALREADWNVSKAARKVGMQRPNLHALMRKYDISGSGEEEESSGESEAADLERAAS
jgi:DNA-binding NtrC family response regulator